MLESPEATDKSGSEDDGEAAEEWNGVEEILSVEHEAEYVDEDKYTMVTVEALDMSKEGLHKLEQEGRKQDDEDHIEEVVEKDDDAGAKDTKSRKPRWTKEKPKDRTDKPKKKKKKFRYETKAERKFTRMKQGARNSREAKSRREG